MDSSVEVCADVDYKVFIILTDFQNMRHHTHNAERSLSFYSFVPVVCGVQRYDPDNTPTYSDHKTTRVSMNMENYAKSLTDTTLV